MKRSVVLSVLLLASLIVVSAKDRVNPAKRMVPLAGKVIEDETHAPVATKLTILLKGEKAFEITTNSDGEFSTTIPESEECEILVHAKGFESQDDVIPLAPNAEHYIEIHLVPIIKLVVDGEVINSKDKKPIVVELKVYRNSDFEEADKLLSDGKFTEAFTKFGFYIIDFSAKGYVDTHDTLWILNSRRKTIHKNYQLTPIEAGLTVQMKNIYFNFGKATLNPNSFVELDQMAEFFHRNPNLKVEIAGHTDNDGPDDYNLILSQARAQEVVNYLTNKNVSREQITAKGYGETKPIDSNATFAGKANNRRVEMVVIKN